MTSWTTEMAARELLSMLPFINRFVAREVYTHTNEEITIVQIRVLGHLIDHPYTMSELAKKRQVSLQSTSELVQGLVERGWVERSPHPADRRQTVLQITEEGIHQFNSTKEMMITHLAPMLDQLSAQELAAIETALPALRRVFTIIDQEPLPETH